MRASTEQVLDVWTRLEEALAGKSTYGGNVAEIYVYLLLKHRPSLVDESVLNDECTFAANDFCAMFTDFMRRRDAVIRVEYGGEWLHPTQYFKKFTPYHRMRVSVVPKELLDELQNPGLIGAQ